MTSKGETVPDERRRPRALLLSYSFTGQSERLVRAAGDALVERGWEVVDARLELTDRRYAPRLSRFPLRHVWRTMLSLVPAQARGAVGEVRVPPQVNDGPYDLICIGSPTWWDRASIPVRSFLRSDDARRLLAGRRFAVFVACRDRWRGNHDEVRDLAQWQGGRYAGEVHATYPGDQLTSMLSLTSFLGSGEQREKYLGVAIPPTNVQPAHLEAARGLAARIAEDA
ncbi:flavodoxin family protein [Tsukamurella conjunctivitidis]|uniref:Flavodoxin family protein n=3 Tax=Tsukamurella TaxID=2060 RepID=A0A5C5S817_9ACTN|nr:flavodoxin family protein [Tsukamurella conjunctivitidis]NMD58157.1 flavodoxin family protein [Tsukamurella columbiensis]TWS30778.1 flavodoxin family protein [Tsukamurella conjunctivitidis]